MYEVVRALSPAAAPEGAGWLRLILGRGKCSVYYCDWCLWSAGALAIIEGDEFAGAGGVQKFTDNILAGTFYDPNRSLGRGLGGHIPRFYWLTPSFSERRGTSPLAQG